MLTLGLDELNVQSSGVLTSQCHSLCVCGKVLVLVTVFESEEILCGSHFCKEFFED